MANFESKYRFCIIWYITVEIKIGVSKLTNQTRVPLFHETSFHSVVDKI